MTQLMIVHEVNEELGTILYSALNSHGDSVYVVVYGLQVTQHNDIVDAYAELEQCKTHALVNEGYLEE